MGTFTYIENHVHKQPGHEQPVGQPYISSVLGIEPATRSAAVNRLTTAPSVPSMISRGAIVLIPTFYFVSNSWNWGRAIEKYLLRNCWWENPISLCTTCSSHGEESSTPAVRTIEADYAMLMQFLLFFFFFRRWSRQVTPPAQYGAEESVRHLLTKKLTLILQ